MSERKVRIERATNGELLDLLLELDEAGKSPIFPVILFRIRLSVSLPVVNGSTRR